MQPPYTAGGAPGHDPLGLHGPTPAVPPMDPYAYAEMRKKYPAMFPPGQAMPMHYQTPQTMMMGPKRSGLPGGAFVLSIIAIMGNILLFVNLFGLYVVMEGNVYGWDEMCCLSSVLTWIVTLLFSFLAILLSSIAFYKVKKHVYEPHKRAKPAFIISLVAGITFVVFHFIAIIFFFVWAINW